MSGEKVFPLAKDIAMRFAGIVLIGLGAASCMGPELTADDAQSSDDGWRRTAQGWERVESWRNPSNLPTAHRYRFSSPGDSRKSLPSWDFHPAALVGIQLLVTVVGFMASPAARPQVRSRDDKSGGDSAVADDLSIRSAA